MGTPVPELPKIDPEKYYKITMDVYFHDPPDCNGLFQGQLVCCRTGEVLSAYIDAASECNIVGNPCGDLGGTRQKLSTYSGTWATFDACFADL